MQDFIFRYMRNGARDWRVYRFVCASGNHGECVALHTTKQGARADCARRNRNPMMTCLPSLIGGHDTGRYTGDRNPEGV